jgi:adhesin transport system outer membrane protein
MARPLQLGCLNLFFGCLAFAPVWAQAQTLEYLIQAALATHPSTQSQLALVASAVAGLDSARWQFFPTPSVSLESASASATDPLYQGDKQVAILRLQQPLYTGGRLSAGAEKAQASLNQSKATQDDTRQQLALRVVQAYGDWLGAHLKTQANEKSEQTHNRLRDQVRRRIDEGVSADSDLVLALGRLDAIRADVTAARTQRDMALARLGQLVGHPVAHNALAPAVAAPRAVAPDVQALLVQAQDISPSVRRAHAQAQVQAAIMAERRADLSPDVYLRLERQHGNFSSSNGTPESRLFLGMSTRLGAGLSTLSNVAGANSQWEAALAEVQVQLRAVGEQVLADHALAQSADARLAAVQASLSSAQEVADSYDRQFLAGRKSWLDVMNAARELAQTETLIADLLSTQVVVSWRLHFYTRGTEAVTQSRP